MRLKLVLIVWMVSQALAWSATSMAQSSVKILDTISGRSLKAIQIAMPEFLKRGLFVDGYRINVMEINGKLTVLFEDAEAPLGQRGSGPGKLGFEVELDGDRVVRASFVR